MAYEVKRTEDEINEQVDRSSKSMSENSNGKYPGMTYEQGVEAALLWVTGQCDELPMEEE